MKYPTISIVMSVFNEDQHLSCAIESCLDQTFEDFELIIIDDGSTDSTQQKLSEYQNKDKRIRLIHQKNRGLAASLNTGISIARGAWIARMDADDIALPERLEKQIKFLKKHLEIDVLGTAAFLKDIHGEDLGVMKMPEDHVSLVRNMYKASPFIHPSVIIRREAILSVGGYCEKVMRAQDYELWSRLYKNFRFHNLQDPLLIYTYKERLKLAYIIQAARVRLLVGWRIGRSISAALVVLMNIITGILSISRLRKSRGSRGIYKNN